MDIITSHNSLDFDGLAAMVAATKLFPHAIPVIPGTLSKNVRHFMGLYKDSLVFRTPHEIDLDAVERVILVDTRNPARLGSLKGLEGRNCEFIIFDHHPDGPGDIHGIINEVHMVGAVTTILVEKIQHEDIPLTPFEATILALGSMRIPAACFYFHHLPRCGSSCLSAAPGADLLSSGQFHGRAFF